MKRLLCTGTVALLMLASSAIPSLADIVTPAGGVLGTNPDQSFSIQASGNISDDFTFTISSPTDLSRFSASVTDSSGEVEGLTIALFGGTPGSPTATGISNTAPGGAGQTAAINDGFALNGSYFIQITGTDPSPGNLTLDVGGSTFTAAVPEPGTWALMGIGFACLGFMAYRRRSNGASLRFV